jgi:hypothetical protein
MRHDAIRWHNYKIKKQMDSYEYKNIQYLFDGILCGQSSSCANCLFVIYCLSFNPKWCVSIIFISLFDQTFNTFFRAHASTIFHLYCEIGLDSLFAWSKYPLNLGCLMFLYWFSFWCFVACLVSISRQKTTVFRLMKPKYYGHFNT